MTFLLIILSVVGTVVVSSPVPDPTPLPAPVADAVPKALERRSIGDGHPSYASFVFHRPYASGYASYIGHPNGKFWESLYSPYHDFYGHGFGYGSHLYGYGSHFHGYGHPWYY